MEVVAFSKGSLTAIALLLTLRCVLTSSVPPVRVAIVGAGIAGSSSAYFIREALEEYGNKLELVVFERTDRLCGRMRSAWLDGKPYEIGAAVAHPKNAYMNDFADILGLDKLKSASGVFGFTTGKGHFVKIGDASSTISLDLSLIERYGEEVVTLETLLAYLFNSFMGVYKKQEAFPPNGFASVADLLASLQWYDFLSLTNQTMGNFLAGLNFSPRLVNELVAITVAAIYNQDLSVVTALSGMTALARSPSSNYWSIRGGNEQLCRRLLDHSEAAVHLEANVTEIIRLKTGAGYSVIINSTSGIETNATFDFVVVAAPIHAMGISLSGFQSLPQFNPGRFQTTTTTLVRGHLNMSFFGMTTTSPPWLIGSTPTSKLPFTLIERTPPADGSVEVNPPVWKVQSTDPLPLSVLSQLYPSRSNITEHTFSFAYPHFASPDTLAPLQLDAGVFYPNGIEWASSAMEMSAIAGRNTAIQLQEALGRDHGMDEPGSPDGRI